MKLEYKILWIDNDLQSYIDNGSVKDIEDFLFARGFEAIIEKVFDEANLEEFISKHDYDLIISDYNLEKTTGDVIIEDIRETRRLDTEILFYTAQGSYKNNPEVKERLAFIERLTFQVGRETLLEKIEKVIELTLKKLLELNATRGLITAATSDLDGFIEEVFDLVISSPFDDDLIPKVQKIFKTDYKEIKKNLIKKCKAHRDSHGNDYKQYFGNSDSFRKWDLLRELTGLKTFDGFDRDLFNKYGEDVINIRNKFAHAKAEEVNGKLVLKGQFGKEGFEYDKDACIKIRHDLISHKRNIEILRTILESL